MENDQIFLVLVKILVAALHFYVADQTTKHYNNQVWMKQGHELGSVHQPWTGKTEF